MRHHKPSAISHQPSARSNHGAALATIRGLAAALVAAAALFSSFGAIAEEEAKAPKKKIMLGAVTTSGIPAEQGRALESLICAELAANKTYDVVCPEDLGAVLKEQALKMGLGACTAGDCMDATGKMMESDFNVTAAVEARDGKFVVSLSVAETKSGARAASATSEPAPSVEKLTVKLKGVVSDLYKNLASPPPQKKPEEKKPAGEEKK
ncbi:MAG: hypothetical protein HY897_21300 [Deltaproteobacteria bacterium]|nr:hypothetical protein [Deltaproteobacteria bacterium]